MIFVWNESWRQPLGRWAAAEALFSLFFGGGGGLIATTACKLATRTAKRYWNLGRVTITKIRTAVKPFALVHGLRTFASLMNVSTVLTTLKTSAEQWSEMCNGEEPVVSTKSLESKALVLLAELWQKATTLSLCFQWHAVFPALGVAELGNDTGGFTTTKAFQALSFREITLEGC